MNNIRTITYILGVLNRPIIKEVGKIEIIELTWKNIIDIIIFKLSKFFMLNPLLDKII
ncbi:hypothetical protein [Aliarcobacter butzleri]|uniref:hypothetical protein n=1 Tax=Aliarcobacter butzleri TaxID=28197 RepID=UPI0013EE7597|nr:hypothetical protein [Aliarcobacter butzleri]